jgi:hypothetical protein
MRKFSIPRRGEPGPVAAGRLRPDRRARRDAQSADASCAARGGSMQPVGRLQRPTCVVPYADAGKTCSDKADCQGACIAEGNLEAQGATTGQCQKTNVQFGCYAKIVGGKSSPTAYATICVDWRGATPAARALPSDVKTGPPEESAWRELPDRPAASGRADVPNGPFTLSS